MWVKAKTDGVTGDFMYEIDDGNFKTDFFVPGYDLKNEKVYLKSTDKKSVGVCLGTLSERKGGCCLLKSYPVSFLETNGVNLSKEFLISVKNEEPKVLSDPAIERAQNILDNHPSGKEEKELSSIHRKVLKETLSGFEKADLPFLKEFTFHKIDNIKHPFNLSSIDHIVLTKEFVSAFVKRGVWYMGEKEDCQIFPLVIARFKDEPDPMMIVSDSYGTYEDKESGLIYHITGIGVLEDGQYFCKIYHEP
ncbi:MAG: hypothetical protein E7394_08600 [Ruminococcaceae bacterium]|nr:hypothetical protein [Oscillospiraceae bacterium]